MKRDIIALVGAGIGGRSILLTLLKIPRIEIKYVCDINPDAPGIALARNNNISCCFDDWPQVIANDPEIDLIFEVTGESKVLMMLNEIKPTNSILVAAAGTEVIFHLLESQFQIAQRLREYKKSLEERIVERTVELEKTNSELGKKVNEHELLNEKLLQINEEKTKYLLQSTHQLKAPFAAIQSYVDVILDGYTGEIPEKTQEIMAKIKDRCELLSKSIKDMLALANLKTCIKDHLNLREVDINKLLAEVVGQSQIIADSRKIKLRLKTSPKENLVKCSRDQMMILFSVLVENAINYSYDDSRIEITVKKSGKKKIVVAVKDYGIGIFQDNMDKIYNEYFRSNEAVARHENGSGLGLSLAREIIHIHNFGMNIDSEPGKGSVFTVTMNIHT